VIRGKYPPKDSLLPSLIQITRHSQPSLTVLTNRSSFVAIGIGIRDRNSVFALELPIANAMSDPDSDSDPDPDSDSDCYAMPVSSSFQNEYYKYDRENQDYRSNKSGYAKNICPAFRIVGVTER
jgi:hypothetical protein